MIIRSGTSKNRYGRVMMLKQHLYRLGTGETLPKDTNYGICAEISNMFGFEFTELLEEQYALWPDGTGHKSIPIPVLDLYKENGYRSYSDIGNKWVGEYGDRRKALCLWVSNQI